MDMRITVATGGTEGASGALHIACALARRYGAAVEVVAALEPFPPPAIVYTETSGLSRRQLIAAGRRELHRQVEEQLALAGHEVAAWPVTVELGTPAPAIARFARATGATLIVLGLGRHLAAERWLGSETALRVMRLAHVPVLAVPAGTWMLPKRAVAAVDFTEFSRDAAETALQIIQPGGTLHLVHVLEKPWREASRVGRRDWTEAQQEELRAHLEKLAQQLRSAHGHEVATHFREGDPARETLRLAEEVTAGLIVAGSHGAGFFSRLLMGSVSTRLVRGARRMVLIAPPRSSPGELEAAVEVEVEVEPERHAPQDMPGEAATAACI